MPPKGNDLRIVIVHTLDTRYSCKFRYGGYECYVHLDGVGKWV